MRICLCVSMDPGYGVFGPNHMTGVDSLCLIEICFFTRSAGDVTDHYTPLKSLSS